MTTPGAGGRTPVSVIVMTKNEEEKLAAALESAASFGEVFVVDSHSTDRTVEIAEAHGAQVVTFTWNGRYPKKKQWCLESLPFSYEWVLYLDADERITPELADEIKRLMTTGPKAAGYFVRSEYVFMGRRLRHGHHSEKLVLLDRRVSRFAERDDLGAANMWEVEGHYQPDVDGRLDRLASSLIHVESRDLFHYFDRHNKYSDWEAHTRSSGEIVAAEATVGRRAMLKHAFNRFPFKGTLAFAHSYLIRGGFRDGREGLHYALARGFYYWQVGIKLRERSTTASHDDGSTGGS